MKFMMEQMNKLVERDMELIKTNGRRNKKGYKECHQQMMKIL